MQEPLPSARRRITSGLLLAAVILLGLGLRKYSGQFPYVLSKSGGDALWTVAVYLTLAIGFPRWSPWKLGAFALSISYLVEFSQIYHRPWIDAIRATLPGKLLLGSVFAWGDLASYTIGAAVATACHLMALRAKANWRPAGRQQKTRD